MQIIDKREIKERLYSGNAQMKDSFGQNYLISPYGITTLLQYISQTDTIIEIGPGIGSITINYLHLAKHIYLIEVDSEKIPILQQVLTDYNEGIYPEWVKIINKDALTVDFSALIKGVSSYQIIGALPYNIAKKIIHFTLQLFPTPQQALFIVQKEVADKYISEVGNETFLSVSSKLFAHIERKEVFPPEYFYPAPKVRSRILKISHFQGKSSEEIQTNELLSHFIKKGFANPRKKLSNTLNAKEYTDDTKIILVKRAEQVSLEEWLLLYNTLPTQDS